MWIDLVPHRSPVPSPRMCRVAPELGIGGSATPSAPPSAPAMPLDALPPLPRRPKVRDFQIVETAQLLIDALRPHRAKHAEKPSLEMRDAVESALLKALRPDGGCEPLSEVERLRLDLLAHAVLLEAVRREVGEMSAPPRADRLDAVAGDIIALVADR